MVGSVTWLALCALLLPRFLDTPPGDLASLVRTDCALRQLGVNPDDETALVAAIARGPARADEADLRRAIGDLGSDDYGVRRRAVERLREVGRDALPFLREAARSSDPEVRLTARETIEWIRSHASDLAGDGDYLRRLFAVRRLAQVRCETAVPLLRAMLDDEDVTLREAAREAIAAIEGRHLPRAGSRSVVEMMGLLPEDTGFVLVLAPQEHAGTAIVEIVSASGTAEGARSAPGFRECTAVPRAGALARAASEIEESLLHALGVAGNVRADAIVVAFPDDFGLGEDWNVTLLVRGLWDGKKVREALTDWLDLEAVRLTDEDTILSGEGAAVIVLDDERAVARLGPGSRDVADIAGRWRAKGARPVPPHIAQAPGSISAGRSVAAAGRLSDAQRAYLRQFARDVATLPEEGLHGWGGPVTTLARLAGSLADAGPFVAEVRDGRILVSIRNTDEAAAARCARSFDEVHAALRGALASLRESGAPAPPDGAVLSQDVPFWSTVVHGDATEVAARLDLLGLCLFFLESQLPVAQ